MPNLSNLEIRLLNTLFQIDFLHRKMYFFPLRYTSLYEMFVTPEVEVSITQVLKRLLYIK